MTAISVLRLLQGDKRNPSRVLDFTQTGGTLSLAAGGFVPTPGKETVLWSRDQRIDSERGNAEIKLTYNLREGGSAAELGYWQREVNRFFHQAGLYEEKRQGEPVWLEYRWLDGLADVPAPVFGQLSHYLRVLHGEAMWPAELHTWLRANTIQGVVANLVCKPVAEGLRQLALNAGGRIEETSRGVVVPRQAINYCTNPSFGHSTWNNGWTASNAALKMTQETRPGYTRSLNSAALLDNTSTTTAYDFRQTLTLTGDQIISCYVRKVDGSLVTSADMQMVGEGGALTTYFEQIDDSDWYLAYAGYTASGASSTHGIQVKAKKIVIVDDVQIEASGARTGSHPLWFCAGYKLGCSWSGTAHASSSSGLVQGYLAATISDELVGAYTCAFWVTPFWNTPPTGGVPAYVRLFEYVVDANNNLVVDYYLDGTLSVAHTVGGTTYTASDMYGALDFGGDYHIVVTNDGTNLKVYVDGVEFATIAAPAYLPTGGKMAIGRDEDAGGYEAESAFDGMHIWKQALSATQVQALYNSEKPVKDDFGTIDIPAYMWNKDHDAILDNCDDSSRDNWGIVGGISGDVEALAEWQIDPPTATPPEVYWLGRKAVEEAFNPASTFWLELQGSADANSSGGEYEQHVFGGSPGTYDFDISVDEIKHLQGRVHFLARLYVAGNAVDVNPFYKFGTGPRIDGEVQQIATNANFLFRAYADWDMWIRWDHLREGETPASLTLGLHVSDATGGGSVRCDFVQVLPYPNCRVEIGSSISLSAGDTLHVIEDEAYVLASSGAEKYAPEFRGEPVNLEPHKFNYVWFLAGEEGQQYDITDTATFVVYVTPRFLLPGGPVA
jgi:hypothetical protein